MPGHHAVLGMHAFGLDETGEHAQAERSGRRAIGLQPRDGFFAVHNGWHLAPFKPGQDRHDEVLAVYDACFGGP